MANLAWSLDPLGLLSFGFLSASASSIPLWLTAAVIDSIGTPHVGYVLGQTVEVSGSFKTASGILTNPGDVGTCVFLSPVTRTKTSVVPTRVSTGVWIAVLPSTTESGVWYWEWETADSDPASAAGAFVVTARPFV